ncbi:MAG: class B sortase [Lachnospiraceae bacterium]|jgi:sortase B|nr:class B sortase [Lachnospiraceae bacterium]
MKKIRGILRCVVAVFSVWACLRCGRQYLESVGEYRRGEEDLARVYAAAKTQRKEEKTGPEGAVKPLIPDYAPLLAENEDVTGWLRIEGLTVDYPVMCRPSDPDFYLNHGFDKAPSAYGMVYMEAACVRDAECRNVLLYGHHMKNGAMFGALDEYISPEFGRAHPLIRFDTLETPGVYRLVAVLCRPAGELTEEFTKQLLAETKEEYEAFIKYVSEERLYDTGFLPEWPKRLVTLMTCEYTRPDGRLFVIAGEIEGAGFRSRCQLSKKITLQFTANTIK